MFNITKDEPLFNRKIFIASIQSAEILKFSQYEVSEKLIKKIDEDTSLEIYDFDKYDNNILNYFLECYKANNDPFLHKLHVIPNIDLSELINHNPYTLSDEQQKYLIKNIYNNDYNKFHDYELALSEFSIEIESKGKFVVAFRKLSFDPIEKTLIIGSKTNFNSNFYISETKHSLAYYTDFSPADFEALYLKDKMGAIETIEKNFRIGAASPPFE